MRSHVVYLASLWPRAAFEDRIPPIVLKHQLYSLCRDRTDVDRQVVSETALCGVQLIRI